VASQSGFEPTRDPVHGFIDLEPLDIELIDTEPMRRLRRIKQLGLTCYVYPGAEHSRFAHSLGTMHLARRIFDVLSTKRGSLRPHPWKKKDEKHLRQLVGAAALLHDVGHPPFSHAAEGLVGEGGHEARTQDIVRHHSAITDALHKHDLDPEQIADLLSEAPLFSPRILHDIVSGELDADRMDYLLRDSMFTGVKYGIFDHERLINCLTVHQDPEKGPTLAIEYGGLHAAEALILARYFMFTQVYFNKVRRVYDLMLTEFLKASLEDGQYPSEVEEYLKWDDFRTWQLLEEARKENETARRIVERDHWQLADETGPHPLEELDMFNKEVQAARRRFGSIVFDDEAEKAPHGFGATPAYVQKRDGAFCSVLEESPVLRGLQAIKQLRLYASAQCKQVEKFCADFQSSYQ